jgi:hypothetical protein
VRAPAAPRNEEPTEPVETLIVWCNFISDIRDRNRFAFRGPSFKTRRRVHKKEMKVFVCKFHPLMSTYPRDRVVNIDETHWKAGLEVS